ncbi:MAG: AI-2E family transporter [Vicinamibacteraceae bacterium]
MQSVPSMTLDPDVQALPTITSMGDDTLEAGDSDDARRGRRDQPVYVHMPVDVRSVALSIIAFGVIVAMLQLAQEVIIPFVVSGLLFYALDPIVDWMQRWRMPRAIGAALVLLLSLGGVGVGAYAISDDVMAVVNQLPEGVRKLRTELRRPSPQPTTLDSVQRTAQELDRAAADVSSPASTPRGVTRVQIEEPPFRASSYLWYGSMGALAITGQAVMVAFLTYFLLVANDLFKRKLVKNVGSTLAKKKVTVQILDEISTQIERFLLVQMATSAIVGIVTALALWALGLEQPVVWGVAAGVLNTIPYFGPIIVTAGLGIVGFLQFGTIEMTLAVASVALVITSLEGWLLTPILLGRVGSLNHIAIFASLLFWSWMWGVWGMLLAVPMLMATKAVCDHIEELQPLADFLGE